MGNAAGIMQHLEYLSPNDLRPKDEYEEASEPKLSETSQAQKETPKQKVESRGAEVSNRKRRKQRVPKKKATSVADEETWDTKVSSQYVSVYSTKQVYKCHECDQCFTGRGNLNKHIRCRHRDDRPYHCPTCDASFKMLCTLKSHIMTHTGEKPFVCKVCGKGFSHKYNMTTHVMVHSGVKKFECDVCGRKFTQPGNLKVHRKTVHENVRPHVCKTCGEGFAHLSKLKRHEFQMHSHAQ